MVFGFKAKERSLEDRLDPAAQAAEATLELVPASGASALYDDVGLFHLWYLERRLNEELSRAARIKNTFSLACWRLRGLPGEAIPKELVEQTATFLADKLRSYDIYSQIDDERFVAILFEADYRSASTVAFRLKGDMQVQMQTTGRWQAGVSTFPDDGTDGDALIQNAFRRLAEDARPAG